MFKFLGLTFTIIAIKNNKVEPVFTIGSRADGGCSGDSSGLASLAARTLELAPTNSQTSVPPQSSPQHLSQQGEEVFFIYLVKSLCNKCTLPF